MAFNPWMHENLALICRTWVANSLLHSYINSNTVKHLFSSKNVATLPTIQARPRYLIRRDPLNTSSSMTARPTSQILSAPIDPATNPNLAAPLDSCSAPRDGLPPQPNHKSSYSWSRKFWHRTLSNNPIWIHYLHHSFPQLRWTFQTHHQE